MKGNIVFRYMGHHTKGRDDMAVKKKFPYKSAVVACNGGCRAAAGELGCTDGCIGCKACVENVNLVLFPLMNMVLHKWMKKNVLPVEPV